MTKLSDNGRYILGEAIGTGGQGTIFAARQLDLDRSVAIKQLADGGQIHHEARLLASLRHPNILTVHELIEVEGRTALVLELIEGPSLATLMGQAEVSTEAAMDLWAAIVDGLAHAHEQGVVHGDISPNNVIIEVDGSRVTPKICDFGVGRSDVNPVGPSGNTDGFVAPERREGGEPTTQADVYSVAVLGRYLLGQDCPDDVGALLSLATSPMPTARPSDAVELASRLQALGVASGAATTVLPVRGNRPPLSPRWFGVWVVPVGVCLAAATWFGWRGGEPEVAVVEPRLALAAMHRGRSDPAQAAALWHAAGAVPPTVVRALGADSLVLPHDAVVTGLAPLGRNLLTADVKGVVREWDLATGTVLRQVSTGVENPVGFQAAGERFTLHPHTIWGDSVSECAAWSLETGDCLASPGAIGHLCARLDARGEHLWYCTRDREEGVASLQTGESLWTRPFSHNPRPAMRVDLPDEISMWSSGRIERVVLRTGERTVIATGLPGSSDTDLVWNADGFYYTDADSLYRVGDDGQLTRTDSVGDGLFDTHVGVFHGGGRALTGTLHTDQGSMTLRHVGWSAPTAWGGAQLLTTTDASGRIDLIDTRSGQRHRSLLGHAGNVMALAQVEEWLASSAMDRTVRLWRPRDEDTGWLRKYTSGLRDAQLSTVGGVFLLGTLPDGRWAVWNASGIYGVLGLPEHVHLDRDAGIVGSRDSDGQWMTVDANRFHRSERSLGNGPARCLRLYVTQDRLVVTRNKRFELYRYSDGSLIDQGSLADRPVGCVTLDGDGSLWIGRVRSPQLVRADGQHAMALPFEGNISDIHTHGGELVVTGYEGQLSIRRDDALALVSRNTTAYAMDGDRLAWATRDGVVHVDGPDPWSSEPGAGIHALQWSAGGALLLAGRSDGVLEVWTRSGRKARSVQAHASRIRALAIEPETGHIVSVDEDGDIQWWDAGRLTAEDVPLVTNYRTCRGTQRVVAVVPFPSPKDRWAPPSACEEEP